MIVQDVMHEGVRAIAPDQPLSRALRLMRREHLPALVVVDHSRLAGILTRTDVERQSRMDGQATVETAMSADVVVCQANESVERCATRMAFHGIQQMPVVASGRILGMVTFADIRRANPREV